VLIPVRFVTGVRRKTAGRRLPASLLQEGSCGLIACAA